MPEPMRVDFVVPGKPQPKQRARRGKGGRWYTPSATADYEALVREHASEAFGALAEPWPVDVRYRLEVWCYFPDARHRDADNVLKAVADALNELAYRDDSQIHIVVAVREFDREAPRTHVVLEAYP
jgi:Holliday junction resolvase RusA-like endonuclease